MSPRIRRHRVTVATIAVLLLSSVAVSSALGLSATQLTAAALMGALLAGFAALLCAVFVETPVDTLEHSVARVSLVTLACIPPALAIRAAITMSLDITADERSALVLAGSVWLVLAGTFTLGVLHLVERRDAALDAGIRDAVRAHRGRRSPPAAHAH